MAVRRGEIYFVDLGSPRGREQAYRRPVLVLSIDKLNRLPLVTVVVPGTSGSNVKGEYPSDVRTSAAASGLPEETVFRCLQITAVDSTKFPSRPVGALSGADLARVEDAVKFALGLIH